MLDIFRNVFRKPAYKSLTKEHGWQAPATGTADETLLPALRSLQDQSSDLVRNEALGSSILTTLTEGAIGGGLKPNASLDFELLGISETEAQEWGQKAEKLFSLWAKSRDCSFSKELRFADIERLVFRSALQFGDCLVVRREKKNSLFPICLQLVEGRRLETPIEKTDDLSVREGIELSKETGEVAAFFVRNQEDLLEPKTHKKIQKNDKEGNSQALLLKNTKRIDQTRGEPLLALVAPLIKVLGRYIQGELDVSALSSYISFVVKSQDGRSVLPDYGVVGMTEEKKSQTPTKILPNSVVNLAPGEDIAMLDPKRPSSSFHEFTNHIISIIGSEVGIPGEVLMKSFQSSYSASRASVLQAHKTYTSKRNWMVNNFHSDVWEWFLSSCIAKGMLEAPGFFDCRVKKQAYLQCQWIGEGALQIDPSKEADSFRKLHELGVISKENICKALGIDYETTKNQLKKEMGA